MSVFIWPLLLTDLYPVTHPAPFHNGSVSRDPVPLRQVRTHVTPPVGRLGAVALPTSFHNGSVSRDPMPLRIADGITIRPIVPIKRAITGCSCHNGSNSRDSMPLRYRAKRKRLQKRLPQDATKNAKFLHRSRLLRNLDSVHIYWGASAMQIEQVHLHRSRLLRNLDSVHIYWGASAMQIEQVHLHCSRLLRIFTA